MNPALDAASRRPQAAAMSSHKFSAATFLPSGSSMNYASCSRLVWSNDGGGAVQRIPHRDLVIRRRSRPWSNKRSLICQPSKRRRTAVLRRCKRDAAAVIPETDRAVLQAVTSTGLSKSSLEQDTIRIRDCGSMSAVGAKSGSQDPLRWEEWNIFERFATISLSSCFSDQRVLKRTVDLLREKSSSLPIVVGADEHSSGAGSVHSLPISTTTVPLQPSLHESMAQLGVLKCPLSTNPGALRARLEEHKLLDAVTIWRKPLIVVPDIMDQISKDSSSPYASLVYPRLPTRGPTDVNIKFPKKAKICSALCTRGGSNRLSFWRQKIQRNLSATQRNHRFGRRGTEGFVLTGKAAANLASKVSVTKGAGFATVGKNNYVRRNQRKAVKLRDQRFALICRCILADLLDHVVTLIGEYNPSCQQSVTSDSLADESFKHNATDPNSPQDPSSPYDCSHISSAPTAPVLAFARPASYLTPHDPHTAVMRSIIDSLAPTIDVGADSCIFGSSIIDSLIDAEITDESSRILLYRDGPGFVVSSRELNFRTYSSSSRSTDFLALPAVSSCSISTDHDYGYNRSRPKKLHQTTAHTVGILKLDVEVRRHIAGLSSENALPRVASAQPNGNCLSHQSPVYSFPCPIGEWRNRAAGNSFQLVIVPPTYAVQSASAVRMTAPFPHHSVASFAGHLVPCLPTVICSRSGHKSANASTHANGVNAKMAIPVRAINSQLEHRPLSLVQRALERKLRMNDIPRDHDSFSRDKSRHLSEPENIPTIQRVCKSTPSHRTTSEDIEDRSKKHCKEARSQRRCQTKHALRQRWLEQQNSRSKVPKRLPQKKRHRPRPHASPSTSIKASTPVLKIRQYFVLEDGVFRPVDSSDMERDVSDPPDDPVMKDGRKASSSHLDSTAVHSSAETRAVTGNTPPLSSSAAVASADYTELSHASRAFQQQMIDGRAPSFPASSISKHVLLGFQPQQQLLGIPARSASPAATVDRYIRFPSVSPSLSPPDDLVTAADVDIDLVSSDESQEQSFFTPSDVSSSFSSCVPLSQQSASGIGTSTADYTSTQVFDAKIRLQKACFLSTADNLTVQQVAFQVERN